MTNNARASLGDTLSGIVDVMDIAMWQLDMHYRVVKCNNKALQIYGDNILGRFCYAIADNRDEVCRNCPAQKVYNGHDSGRSEHMRVKADGAVIHIDHIATPIRDAYGALTGVFVFIIDITERKLIEKELVRHRNQLEAIVQERTRKLERTNRNLQHEIAERTKAETALKKSEKKFRTIFENLKDVYFETTLDGWILTMSPSGSDFSGYTTEELIGNRAEMLFGDSQDREALLKEISAKGKVRDYELVFKRKNGDLYDVSINADLTFGESGNPEGLTGTIRDITLQKRYQERAYRLKKMESLGLMAGGIAHDLNNILSGIVSYPDLLLMDLPEQSPYRRPIQVIKESGQRAVEVVSDLLTIARGIAVAKTVADLNGIVREYLDSPEYRRLKNDFADIEFQTDLQPGLDMIKCSAAHIKKILINLVMNAVEAIEGQGSVTIRTANCSSQPPGANRAQGHVLLSVTDSGQGVSPKDMERIFEPFYTRKVMGRNGTGLGLAVVWNAVQDHGGRVDIRSGDGETVMEILFPSAKAKVLHTPTPDASEPLEGSGQSILVVDDEAHQREIATDMLTKLGYRVESAASGEEAVARVKIKAFDLIVLDMIMAPGISGRETLEQIVQVHPGQKAIIVSGYTASEDVRAAQKIGAGKFIEKPYTVEKIGRAIQEELQRTGPVSPA